MNNFNFSIVEGNLVKDPEVKMVTNGNALCKFRIGSNRTRINKEGEKVEESGFFDVTTWAKLAEICGKYLKKGSKVLVSGILKQDQWVTDDGQTRSRIYIEGREVNFLSPRPVEN